MTADVVREMLPVLVLALIVLLEVRHAFQMHDVRQEAAAWWAQCNDKADAVERRVARIELRLQLGADEARP